MHRSLSLLGQNVASLGRVFASRPAAVVNQNANINQNTRINQNAKHQSEYKRQSVDLDRLHSSFAAPQVLKKAERGQ